MSRDRAAAGMVAALARGRAARRLDVLTMTLDDAREAVRFCDSYNRLPTILELFGKGLSRVDTLRLLCDEWSGCDNVGAYLSDLGDLLSPPAAEMMTDAERAALAALPAMTATVRRSNIIALKLDRGESEILTWAARVRTIADLPRVEESEGPNGATK